MINLSAYDSGAAADWGTDTSPAEVLPISVKHPHRDAGHYWADLEWVLTGQAPDAPQPVYARRQDGVGLFYPAAVNGVFGDPETGKSWLSHIAVVEALAQSQNAAIVDADHNGAPATVRRLLALGADAQVLADPQRFRYIQPDDDAVLTAAITDLAGWGASVVVLDSLGELLPLMGSSSLDNDEVTSALRRLTVPLIGSGCCVITIDHLPKRNDTGSGYAIGAGAKKRAIRGAYLRVQKVNEVVPGGVGRIALHIEKDSAGTLRATSPDSKKAGVLILDARNPDRITWTIQAPGAVVDTPGQQERMARISQWLQANPGDHSRTAITQSVEGKKEGLASSLDELVRGGYVAEEATAHGTRTDRRYRHIKPFAHTEDPHRSTGPTPVPHRPRTGAEPTNPTPVPPVPPPIGGTGTGGGPGDTETQKLYSHTGPINHSRQDTPA